MKIPQKIQTLLDRRERLAYQLMETCSELDTWLEENGANLQDSDLRDCTITGCMIYCEPDNAKQLLWNTLKRKCNSHS